MAEKFEKRIYTCATAHLDTIWNWDFEHTITNCLYNTLVGNFELFENYKDYKFNFEGSYRYELFEEYYPEYFETLKKYIEEGRWNVTGSAYENGDVNVPSPEALFRNILYGNGYFRKKFGKTSKEIYLPDCFGFGYALPSIIRHGNLLGFTTQKLTWGSAYGTPFDIGKWYGVDGNYCFACVKPGPYVNTYIRVRDKKDNKAKLAENEAKYGLPWTFSFHGVGDQGGRPTKLSVAVMQREIDKNDKNDVKVISARSDEIYDDLNALSDEQKDKLPTWNNELVMTAHAVGGYTSRAIGKRWNRRCEELADVTERAAVLGTALGNMQYPATTFEKSWKRAIAHQFHDDIPGTSVQRGYQRSWNDYVLSMNQLENEYTHSVGAVAKAMDTSWVKGTAVVVNNSLEQERKDVVTVALDIKGAYVKVLDKKGKSVPCQIISRDGDKAVIAVYCEIKSLGYKVLDIQEADKAEEFDTDLKVTDTTVENSRYSVAIDSNGDICSIIDKKYGKDLIKKSIRHQLIKYEGSSAWPAWELNYNDIAANITEFPTFKSKRVLYSGPVTAAIEVTQEHGGSIFKSVIVLDKGSEYVKVYNEIEWWEREKLLKDRFTLSVSNEKATYDLGLGAIVRGNNTEKLYEVPAQKWADITEKGFGVSVISDCKYGWDKPANNTLRMTVLHTPKGNYKNDSMQSLMEIGLNRYGYAIHSHANDIASTQKYARQFNQPLSAVVTDNHKGKLGAEYSFGAINKENVILRAMKKAEDSDEIIVRFNEGANLETADIAFTLGAGIESAREVFASEETAGEAKVEDGKLIFDLGAYAVKSFALKLKAIGYKPAATEQTQLKLPVNYEIFTSNKKPIHQVIRDYKETYIPKEINPGTITFKGIDFALDESKAVKCSKQAISLGKKYDKVYLLAFSMNKDKQISFLLDGKEVKKTIHSTFDRIGIWDLVDLKDVAGIKECDLAWEFTHAHNENGADIVARQMLVFAYELDTKDIDMVALPDDSDIIILAATGVNGDIAAALAYPMYDRVSGRRFTNRFSKAQLKDVEKVRKDTSKPAHKNKRFDKKVVI
ncbi:MAG: hypothetical protein IKY78_05220 [Clostridia bacterium]|nr:hypothetical protein [Clostridia bacterium]